jgi:hypothetical protein
MINRGKSQLLNGLNGQQFGDKIALDNQIGIVSETLLNNILFLQPFKNEIGNGDFYLNVNRNFPPIQYQNQIQKNNMGELDESNLLELLRNLSLEPSNQKINNIPLLEQSLYGIKNSLGMGNSQVPQIQQPWTGPGVGMRQNNNINNNLLLKQAILLQLINNNNLINNQINQQLNS